AALHRRVESAVDGERGSFGNRRLEMAGDAVAMFPGDERAHLAARLGARADLDFLDALANGVDELVGGAAYGEDDRDGHATLAGCSVSGGDCGIGGPGDVGVGGDE